MLRSEAWELLGQLWDVANEAQREALSIAMDDIQFVDLMPTVRCKDCKHRLQDEQSGVSICKIDGFILLDLERFCSDGERKEDNAN